MLEWTGERFLPWLKESTIAYEHLHRYAYAAALVTGKRVLDLACGEGYGSKMLAAAASSVVGIDIDSNSVAHAAARYGSEKLQYLAGSITAVPIPDNQSFDAIVCFEAIEHIEDHERLLGEVKRLLKPDGVFLVSTPNKVVYNDESHEENPFHVKELSFEEFQELLARHFVAVQYLGQRIHPGSSIWPMGPGSAIGIREFVLERDGMDFQFIGNDKRVPLYFIAIASNLPALPPQPGSVLLDHSDGLIREKDAELHAAAKGVEWREHQLKVSEEASASLEEAVRWREQQIQERDEQIAELTEGLEWTRNRVTEMGKTIGSQEEALAWRAHQVADLETGKTSLVASVQSAQTDLQDTQRQLAVAIGRLEAIYLSPGWKFIVRVRHAGIRLAPPGSSRRRFFEKLMGLVRSRG